jgi:hypothetical protein
MQMDRRKDTRETDDVLISWVIINEIQCMGHSVRNLALLLPIYSEIYLVCIY